MLFHNFLSVNQRHHQLAVMLILAAISESMKLQLPCSIASNGFKEILRLGIQQVWQVQLPVKSYTDKNSRLHLLARDVPTSALKLGHHC